MDTLADFTPEEVVELNAEIAEGIASADQGELYTDSDPPVLAVE